MGGGPYAQCGPKLRVIFPSWIGDGNWGGWSFDPKLGYFIVNMENPGNLNKMIRNQNGTRGTGSAERYESGGGYESVPDHKEQLALPDTSARQIERGACEYR